MARQTVRMVTRASPATERPATRSGNGTPGIAGKLNHDLILDLVHCGGYLEDKGEAREPRHLSQCSGPECWFVNFICCLFVFFLVSLFFCLLFS